MSALLVAYDGQFTERTTRRAFVAELRASGFDRLVAGRALLAALRRVRGPACVVLVGRRHDVIALRGVVSDQNAIREPLLSRVCARSSRRLA